MLIVPNLIGSESAHYSSLSDFVTTMHEWMLEKNKEPKNCSQAVQASMDITQLKKTIAEDKQLKEEILADHTEKLKHLDSRMQQVLKSTHAYQEKQSQTETKIKVIHQKLIDLETKLTGQINIKIDENKMQIKKQISNMLDIQKTLSSIEDDME